MQPRPKNLGGATAITAFTSMLGVLGAVVLDAMVVARYGLGWQTDAYFIALTIPLLVMTILALQASRVVQPVFINLREKSGEKEAWHFLDLMMVMSVGAGVIVLGLGVALSPFIIRLQSPGASDAALKLSINLSMLFFLSLAFYCPISVMRAVLVSTGQFGLSGATKLFDCLFKMAFLLGITQGGIYTLAWGMLAGAVFQVFIYYFSLRNRGYRFHPAFDFRHVHLRQAGQMMTWPLASQSIGMVSDVISNYLGSKLGGGNVTALRFATRIIDSLAGTFANSIVVAAMPAVTACLANGEVEEAKRHLRHGIYLLLLITLPLSIWLALIRYPLIAMIYQRLSFTAQDTALVANILLLMIPYIFLSRLLGLSELVFFGACDTRTPLLGSLLQTVLYASFALAMISHFKIYSLPIARSLSYAGGAFLMLYLTHIKIGGVRFLKLVRPMAKLTLACAAMGAFILIGKSMVSWVPLTGILRRLALFGFPSLLGSLVLVAAMVRLDLLDTSRLRKVPLLGRWLGPEKLEIEPLL